ncbi:MAG: hypothetical protein ACI4TK_17860 [Agathobacter sp.]
MTREQLVELLEFKSHLSLDGYYTTRYVYQCEQYSVIWDTVTPRKDDFTVGKSYCELTLISDGEVVYEGRKIDNLVEAITEVEKLKSSYNQ